jgi:hypothetical protein
MSAFELFVNTELPRRSAHLTVGIAGYDGDPNDGGAPSILKNSPQGTWYQRETPAVVWYRKEIGGIGGATSWVVPSGGGGATQSFAADCPSGVAVGDAVHVTGAKVGGVAQVATCDITSLSAMPAVGVVTAKPTSTDCTVQFGGEVAVYSGLTPGKTYMVDQNGEPTATLPTVGSDHYVQRIGIATSTDSMLLLIDGSLVKRRV